MSSEADRDAIAGSILNFEARRDKQGRLAVYNLPPGDGGGAYEVAGINERYHPEEAAHLAELIGQGKFAEAERAAREFIATNTDFVERWSRVTAIESYLRDCAFNRGPRGAARILQRALSLDDDGVVGPATLAAVASKEASPRSLLDAMRRAREQYERDVAHRDESSKFWKGLVNRWNKALEFAVNFLNTSDHENLADATPTLFDAASAAVADAKKNSQVSNSSSARIPPSDVSGGIDPAPALSPPNTNIVLRALRQGMIGDLVKAWQSFLAGQGYPPGGLDGEFGDKTVAATRAFQLANGLDADGIAGRQTLLAAMQQGFELIEEPAADLSGSNFPPRPNFQPLVSTAARQAVFGAFDFVPEPRPDNPENIRILRSWIADNIVQVPIPQLRKALGAKAPATIAFHRAAAEQLMTLWEQWESEGLLDRILSWDGSFVPRYVRHSTTNLSNHSFGSAFDINASLNQLGRRPPLVGERGSVRELVPAANQHGFYWGGHFSSRLDGMHFEVAFLK